MGIDGRVNVVLVDYEGNRHFIQGRQGQTLRQACEMNNVSLVKDDSNGGGGLHSAVRSDYYTESLFGEGACLLLRQRVASHRRVETLTYGMCVLRSSVRLELAAVARDRGERVDLQAAIAKRPGAPRTSVRPRGRPLGQVRKTVSCNLLTASLVKLTYLGLWSFVLQLSPGHGDCPGQVARRPRGRRPRGATSRDVPVRPRVR